MSTAPLPHSERANAALDALTALGDGVREHVKMSITCSRSHHLAKVYDTGIGAVFASELSSRGHGQRDRVSTGHGLEQGKGKPWLDVLQPGDGPTVDDALPSWCACGQHNLSRAAVSEWLADGEKRVVVR